MAIQRYAVRDERGSRSTHAPRWAWLPVLLVGIALLIAIEQALSVTGNPALVPSLLVLATLVIPVSFVVYVDGRHPVYELPLSVLLGSALLGGVLGAAVASMVEFGAISSLGELPAPAIGLIEEAAKLLPPIAMLIVSRNRSNPADGLLLGVAVGMGFAVLETLSYGFVTLLASSGDLIDAEGRLLLRAMLSPAAHAAWTGLAAAALWYAHGQRWRPRGLAAAVGAFLLAVVLHTLWDWDPGTPWYGYLLIGVVSFALLLHQTHRVLLTPDAPDSRSAGSTE